jgi:hypothetical protein
MTKLEKIQLKVTMHFSLKHYFSSFSDEFKKFDYSEKIEFLKEVLQNGFSTYDLSENFRKERADRYSNDHLQKQLVRNISYVFYNNILDSFKQKYYKEI